jgi:hypothetical protein
MAFPIVALLTAAASDLQTRQQEKEAIGTLGNRNLQEILRRRAAELGGSPYAIMAEDHKSQLSDLRRATDESRNNQIGNLLQAYLKQPKEPDTELETGPLIGGAPTISDLPGVGDKTGMQMVDDLFGGESKDLGVNVGPPASPFTNSSFNPYASSGAGLGTGAVDNIFGGESSKLWEDDPWGSGAF